ncbi:hypothetical protein AK830_g8493 [Neonectria ditissima]|uniref:Ubiquitin-like domain-containing protein n=1 Tax=Neonectria ditissima TaxID=78410 RepID=A0A0P7AXB4_9HYPO|nr:hypothetical protein AK830_g8493 [Neonectria ditissima]
MTDGTMASSPPKKKKLPFKRTAVRRSAAKDAPVAESKNGDDDDLALFRRAKEMAPIITADSERRLKRALKHRELETKTREAGRHSSVGAKRSFEENDEPVFSGEIHSDGIELQANNVDSGQAEEEPTTQKGDDRNSELVTPPPSKRSRLSSGSSKKPSDSIEATEDVSDASPSTRRFRSRRADPESPIRRPQNDRSFTLSGAPVISIDSDDESDNISPRVAPLSHRSTSSLDLLDPDSPQPSPPPPEDDEFAEYVRRAEQRAREQALLRSADDGSQAKVNTKIFVSSSLPGSHPILVKFLFDKPLRLVRESWVALQAQKGTPIPEGQKDDIILTWRRQKIYNYSTLLSLGIRSQADGRLVADSHSAEGLTESRTRVHMEAWTPESFQQMEREEETRRRRDAGDLPDEDTASEPEPPEVKIKIILKARDLDDVKLTVRPETTVETLVTGFRTQRDVPASQEISLWFDGDRLEEHVTMDEADIDDMDTIEVHVK